MPLSNRLVFFRPFAVALLAALALIPTRPAYAQTVPPQPAPGLSQPAPAQAAPAPSQQQAYTLAPDKLAKAIALSRIRNILAIVGGIWGIVFLWILLATRAWARVEAWAQRRTPRRWLQGALFFCAFFIFTTLASLPLDIYAEHASRSYGVSVQSWPSWFGDQGKALAIALVFGTLVLLLFNWIVRRWPRRYWFGLWLVTLPILVAVMFAEPVLIEPLFDKFQPLQQTDPGLVQQLEKVVARTGTDIPPSRMFLMKASVKTNGLNAYVSGIGATKRIVVWDTTAGRIPDDEVLFIFGHESGHYVLNHIPKMLAGTAFGLFFVYWGCAGLADWMVRRFGPAWGTNEVSSRTGFIVLLFVISIASFLLEPVSNGFSRYFEHQADIYGQEAIHGIVPNPQLTAVAAFDHLGEAWLEEPNPSPFIEFWLYNHPSVEHRANFAAHYNPWANGGHGEFFTH
ncbi:MAG: M48 family metallopeptidase [Acidobacteriota bacterium]